MIISFFEVNSIEKRKFKEKLKGNTLLFFNKPIQDINYTEYEKSDVISVFVHSKVNENTIGKCTNLKLITTRSTGIDHIDINFLKLKNIVLKNVALYGENTVAEHTFALILSISRKIYKSYVKTLNSSSITDELTGFDLKNKTIGIIGGGRIGLHVAHMARSFGMHVRVYDIHEDKFLSELINFKYVSFDELLKTSDIISLHVPLNKNTINIINKDTISKMKHGVVIINTARGGLINNEDLIDGLNSKKILGAGLDVLDGEEFLFENSLPSVKNDNNIKDTAKIIIETKLLTNLPNVVITPHNAYNSIEAINRIIDTTINNILDFSY